ncbi:MAG: hypothetical protein HYV59_09840 [Planctomycetes bacterium]|nr:hypothetical protein [Planctomycetota bacterium]
MSARSLTEKTSLYQINLRFFDVDVTIKSDCKSFVDLFSQMYHKFLVDRLQTDSRSTIEFALLAEQDDTYNAPVIVINNEIWPLSNARLFDGYAYECVLSTIIARIQSHLLLHAGVVSRNGQGVIILADSGFGKTTLVIELVKRGFKFLSDEMAALGRTDGRVHPFPRCLWIRKGTLELTGIAQKSTNAPRWMGKTLLDIEDIVPGSYRETTNVNHVIILHDDARPENGLQDISVLVERLDNSLLACINEIEGVENVRVENMHGYPLIKCTAVRPTSTLAKIELFCREFQTLMLNAGKGKEHYPSFSSPARLEDIPKSEAVVSLLKRFQGGYMSKVLHDEFSGNSIPLFLELSAMIEGAKCYRLSVGPLKDMADLVCGVVGVQHQVK